MFQKYSPVTRADYQRWIPTQDAAIRRVQSDPRALRYHLMPRLGWLNDPNGLCQFHGIYHIYYQYDPFDVNGDLKLWAHLTTTDFIHYEEHEPFLFPDSALDAHGAYSGSAFVKDDQIHFFYTGNIKLFDRPDYDYIHSGRVANTIHLVSPDGFQFERKELVMGMEDYPEGFTQHIRDPKLIEEDGVTYMVQGTRDDDDHGALLLFSSDDLSHWQYRYALRTKEPLGYMWECPDLFVLDGQHLLITCPQGVPTQGADYANVHSCVWMQLSHTLADGLTVETVHQLDRGFDFYAPQSFADEQGRRILIGWMGIPDADYTNPTTDHGWQHALTIPRLLSWKDGMLHQQPLPELEGLRRESWQMDVEVLNARGFDEECYELELQLDGCKQLTLSLSEEIRLTYQDQLFTLDITACGCGRTTRSVHLAQLHDLHLFSDTSSLEVFLNEGSEVFTTRIYPTRPRCVKLKTEGQPAILRLHALSAHQIR